MSISALYFYVSLALSHTGMSATTLEVFVTTSRGVIDARKTIGVSMSWQESATRTASSVQQRANTSSPSPPQPRYVLKFPIAIAYTYYTRPPISPDPISRAP